MWESVLFETMETSRVPWAAGTQEGLCEHLNPIFYWKLALDWKKKTKTLLRTQYAHIHCGRAQNLFLFFFFQ